MWIFMLKRDITGKHSEKRRKQQRTENQRSITYRISS